jgi:hypothetical protein
MPTGHDGMMRAVPITLGKTLAAMLVTLCLGVQVLEATGHWDGTLQDTTDEAIVVAVVLCVGAGIAIARAMCQPLALSAIRSFIVIVRTARRLRTSFNLPLAVCIGPPLRLRI